MKKLFSILLLVIIACYVMPGKNCCWDKSKCGVTCTDNSGEETDEVKKETKKDLFITHTEIAVTVSPQSFPTSSPAAWLSSLLHMVETPPPDVV
jgi:hypothetical protein